MEMVTGHQGGKGDKNRHGDGHEGDGCGLGEGGVILTRLEVVITIKS